MKKLAIPKEIDIQEEIASTKRTGFPKNIAILSMVMIAVIGAIILLACSSNRLPKKERTYLELVQLPAEAMNTLVELTLPESGNSLKFGDPILLNLVNLSRETLIFPADYGIVISTYDEESKEWRAIDNDITYPHVGDRQLAPIGKDNTGEVMFSVLPDMQAFSQPVVIRVLVAGTSTVTSDTTSEPASGLVGASLEVSLSP